MIAIDAISGLPSTVSTVAADGLNSPSVRKSSDEGGNAVLFPIDSMNGGIELDNGKTPARFSQTQDHESQVTGYNPEKPRASFNHVRFDVDQETKNTVISVIDDKSQKVLYQIPPEDLRRVSDNLRKSLGMIFDEMM